ncbi:MAG: hypothetical protein RR751_05225 [Clostridia bacterium]
MKEKSFLKDLLQCICTFISIIIFAGAVVTVCVTNTGGKVSKYLDYSSKVVLEQEANGRLNQNDLIVTKEKETYQAKDYIWYFTSEKDTQLGEVESIVLEETGPEYDIKDVDKNVSDINVIGSVEYKVPAVGKLIVFLKEIPLLVYASGALSVSIVTLACKKFLKKNENEEENKQE